MPRLRFAPAAAVLALAAAVLALAPLPPAPAALAQVRDVVKTCSKCQNLLPSSEPEKRWSGRLLCRWCYDAVREEEAKEAEARKAAQTKDCGGGCGKKIFIGGDPYVYVGAGGMGSYFCSDECAARLWSCSGCGTSLAKPSARAGRFQVYTAGDRKYCRRCYDGLSPAEKARAVETAPPGGEAAAAPAGAAAPAEATAPAKRSGWIGFAVIGVVVMGLLAGLFVLAKKAEG